MDTQTLRSLIPAANAVTYFNTGWAGPSPTPVVERMAEAMRLLRGVGFGTIEARARELANRMKGGLAEMSGCRLTGPADDDVSSSLVAVALEGWEPAAAVEQLWERWRIGARAVNNPPAIRFSVAAFNTETEIDTALEAVKALVREGPKS